MQKTFVNRCVLQQCVMSRCVYIAAERPSCRSTQCQNNSCYEQFIYLFIYLSTNKAHAKLPRYNQFVTVVVLAQRRCHCEQEFKCSVMITAPTQCIPPQIVLNV